jgi:hypothetical protein
VPAGFSSRLFRSLFKPSRLCHQITLFWNTRCPACSGPVRLDGALVIAKQFEQMGTNRVKTMMLGKPGVAVKRLELGLGRPTQMSCLETTT